MFQPTPAFPLSATPGPGGQRVRLRAAYRQQFPHLSGAVGIAGSRGAHRRGRVDPPTGGARDLCRQYRGDAGTLLERPVPGDTAPRRQPGASRYAIPFFLGPNHDSVVDCVPTCVGPDNPPHYEPTTYGAFTQRLLTLNFAHRRADGASEYASGRGHDRGPAVLDGGT